MDEALLQYYNTEWERFTTAMKFINHIFQYLVWLVVGNTLHLANHSYFRIDTGSREKLMTGKKRFTKYTQ